MSVRTYALGVIGHAAALFLVPPGFLSTAPMGPIFNSYLAFVE